MMVEIKIPYMGSKWIRQSDYNRMVHMFKKHRNIKHYGVYFKILSVIDDIRFIVNNSAKLPTPFPVRFCTPNEADRILWAYAYVDGSVLFTEKPMPEECQFTKLLGKCRYWEHL